MLYGSPWRVARLAHLITAVAAQPGASLPAACGSWAATKAAYRFFADEAVEPAAIVAAHVEATVARLAQHRLVLVLQDTTELDFSHHPALASV